MVELAHHVLRTGALVRVHGEDTEILLEHRRASSPAGGITMLQEICETVTSSKGLERGCVCVCVVEGGGQQTERQEYPE